METLRAALSVGSFRVASQIAQSVTADRQLDSDELRVIRAELSERTGDSDTAWRRARELLAQANLSEALRARCLTLLGTIVLEQGRSLQSVEYLNEAISAAERVGAAEIASWAKLRKFLAVAETSSAEDVRSLLSNLRVSVVRTGQPRIAVALHVFVAEIESQRGATETARRHLNVANALLRSHHNLWLQGLAEIDALCLAFLGGDLLAAKEHAERALEAAARSGHMQTVLAATANLAHIELAQDQLASARSRFRQALAMSSQSVRSRVSVLDGLAQLEVACENWSAAEKLLNEATHCSVPDLSYAKLSLALTRVRMLVGSQLYKDAEAEATRGLTRARAVGDARLGTWFALSRAEARGLLRGIADARADLEASLRQSNEMSLDLQAEMSRVLGRIASQEGDREAALEEFDRSAALHMAVGNIRASRNTASLLAGMGHSREDGNSPPARGSGYGVSSRPDLQLRRAAAAIAIGSRPDLLAAELTRLAIAAGCAACVATLACGDSEPCVVSVLGWTKEEALLASARGECQRIELGLLRGERWQLLVRLHPTVKACLAWLAVRSLAASIEELAVARRDMRERKALWPIEDSSEPVQSTFISEGMTHVLRVVRRVAPTSITVLLTGETGAGKEVLARVIHHESQRSGPFVPFNCAAVPRDMLEAQLFGHKRGAFTGAQESSLGVVRAAAGGTVFLDEVGEIPLELQPKLLRLLESGEVHPLGEPRPLHCDVRIVAATNRDLEKLVRHGSFREDLFYRLNGISLHVPPLRERREEIPRLVWLFVDRFAREMDKGRLSVADETMEFLVLHDWPGNVRQLMNELRRVVALADPDSALTPEQLGRDITGKGAVPAAASPPAPPPPLPVDGPLAAAVEQLERTMIARALERAGGRVDVAARALGLSRKGLYLKRQRLGIQPPGGGSAPDTPRDPRAAR